MPKKNPHWVVTSADAPINRRTTPTSPPPAAPVAKTVSTRIHLTQTRYRLGTPLAQQWAAIAIPQRTVMEPLEGGFIRRIVRSILRAIGIRPTSAPSHAGINDWISPADWQKLDTLLENLAAQSPPDTLEQEQLVEKLVNLKASVMRCATLLIAGYADGTCFVGENHFYVGEAVRRYIPDTITACLQVPAKDRARLVLENNQTAMDLLHAQLALIAHELGLRETDLSQATGEDLLRQHRFLAAKTRRFTT
jgi:hypothetical protein